MQKKDIVIIGGGPAGLATAMHLLRQSPEWASRIVVLEKSRFPRPKLCGGGITPFGLEQLDRLGLQLEIKHVPVSRIIISYLDLEVEYIGSPAAAVVDRQAFDTWLLEKARSAGVEVHEGCAVTGLERRQDGILLHTSDGDLHARAVVGADGSTGRTRRWLLHGGGPDTARVLEVFSSHRQEDGNSQEISFRFDPAVKDVQGYFWNFPSKRDGKPVFNFGVYDSRVCSGPRADLAAVLKSALSRDHASQQGQVEKVRGASIHLFTPWNRFSTDRVLLAGDAAGVEPLFGEGISLALAYGEAAALQLERAFRNGRFGFRGYRWRLLFSTMGRYMTLRWFVAKVGYRIANSERMVRAVWWIVKLLVKREYRFR